MNMLMTQPVETPVDACWREFRRHAADPARRARLAECYLPLVAREVERLIHRLPRQVQAGELLGAGVEGLYDALESFRGDRAEAFPAFAVKRIRGAVLDELRRLDPLTRDQRRAYHRVCAAIANLTERHKRTPSLDEIAAEAGLTAARAAWMLEAGRQALSLEEEGPDGRPLVERAAVSEAPGPRDLADLSLAREELRNCYRRLPVREQQLLYLRLHADLRLSEIAAAMGISEGRVSQLYAQAVNRLRALMEETPPRPNGED